MIRLSSSLALAIIVVSGFGSSLVSAAPGAMTPTTDPAVTTIVASGTDALTDTLSALSGAATPDIQSGTDITTPTVDPTPLPVPAVTTMVSTVATTTTASGDTESIQTASGDDTAVAIDTSGSGYSSTLESVDLSGMGGDHDSLSSIDLVVAPIMPVMEGILNILIFLIYAFYQYMLSKKLEVRNSWLAWIPGLNIVNAVMIAGKTLGWLIRWFLIGYLLPILTFLIMRLSVVADIVPEFISGLIMTIGMIWLMIACLVFVIQVAYGTALRTGHGKWWTLGLVFATWLMLPVTALHYQKWDEITPRPFGGFKLFLLIIGVFLFPLLVIGGAIFFITSMIGTTSSYMPIQNMTLQETVSPLIPVETGMTTDSSGSTAAPMTATGM